MELGIVTFSIPALRTFNLIFLMMNSVIGLTVLVYTTQIGLSMCHVFASKFLHITDLKYSNFKTVTDQGFLDFMLHICMQLHWCTSCIDDAQGNCKIERNYCLFHFDMSSF